MAFFDNLTDQEKKLVVQLKESGVTDASRVLSAIDDFRSGRGSQKQEGQILAERVEDTSPLSFQDRFKVARLNEGEKVKFFQDLGYQPSKNQDGRTMLTKNGRSLMADEDRFTLNDIADIVGTITNPEVLKGAGKSFLRTATQLSEAGQRGLSAITGIKPSVGIARLSEEITTPEGELQELGATIGETAQFVAGGVAGAPVRAAARGLARGAVGKIAAGAAVEGATAGAIRAAQTGDVEEAKEAAIAGALTAGIFDSAIPVAQSIKNFFGRSAEKLTSSALKLTPSQVDKISKQAKVSPEKYLLDRGIVGSAEEIVNKLDEVGKISRQAVDDSLSSVQGTFADDNAKKLANVLEEKFQDSLSPEGQEIFTRAAELRKKPQLTLPEINEIKRLSDRELNLFTPTGLKESILQKDLGRLRLNVQKFIEDTATDAGIPNIKSLNKETQVSRSIKDAITKTEGRRGANNIISLSDFLTGQSALAFIDPLSAAGIVLSKKVIESPKFKTGLAKGLNKLSKSEFNKLAGLSPQNINSVQAQILRKVFQNIADVQLISNNQ